jgi:hypothetical protein
MIQVIYAEDNSCSLKIRRGKFLSRVYAVNIYELFNIQNIAWIRF